MAGKRKQSPKRKATTSLQEHARASSSPSKRRTDKETQGSLESSSTSIGESSSRRKQKKPIRKRQYTDMIMYGKRFKLSLKMLKEIKTLQSQTKLVLPRAPFARVIREILTQYGQDIRVQQETLEALQQATEMYMHQFFEDSNLCAIHDKRVTLFPKDMHLVKRLRGSYN